MDSGFRRNDETLARYGDPAPRCSRRYAAPKTRAKIVSTWR